MTRVLDDGFVRLVDHMGSDSAIVSAARVSYSKGTVVKRKDEDLLRFLMRHEHYSPFSMCQVKFHVRMPLFINVQALRHDRFHWNLMSGRYSVMPTEKFSPEPEDIRGQGSGNKQVGNGELDDNSQHVLSSVLKEANRQAETYYNLLLKEGMCREQARSILPFGQYTEGFVTANLGDWLLFLKQRLDPHAQLEIRVYAEAIRDELKKIFPVTIQAFEDYQLNSVTFSAMEMKTLRAMLNGRMGSWSDEHGNSTPPVRVNELTPETRLEILSEHIPTKRERIEFWSKITGSSQ